MANKSFKILPKNLLSDWGEMEAWAESVSSAPTGWNIGTTAAIARESTNIKFGSFSARVIGSTGALGGIYRTIPNGDDYAGRTFTLGVWGKSTSTGPYIELHSGISSKTYHLDGLNAFSFFTTPSFQIEKTATQLTVGLWASINATAYFDGAVLCEGENLFTDLADGNILVSDWSPALEVRSDVFEVAGREGAIVPDVHRKGRPEKLRGTVVGSDVASTRTHFDNLVRSLISWRPDEKRTLYMFDDRCQDVFLQGLSYDYVRGANMIEYQVNLVNPEAVTRFIGKLRSRSITTGTAYEFNLNYNGTAESLPLISFLANQGSAITTCQLENMTTGDTMAYTGTVPTSVALDINSLTGSVLNSSVNRIADFGTSDFLKLVRGTNRFRFSGTPCQINIDYFENYL